MESRVMFVDEDLRRAFRRIAHEDPRLHKEIAGALEAIRKNAFFGRRVKKKLIPRELLRRREIDNLWLYNLRRDWRLLYTIRTGGVEVLAIVLDWLDHKSYERLFKF